MWHTFLLLRRVESSTSIGVIISTPWIWATVRPRIQSKNGSTCGVIPDVVDLEERNAQAFSGERKILLMRGTTRDIGVIDVLAVRKISNPEVTGGIKGLGGAASRVA